MYCPRCATEVAADQNYCRKCGVNLSLVSKAVRIGDTIAHGDSGLLPKIKSVVGDLKLDEMSEQIGRHFDKITSQVERGSTAEIVEISDADAGVKFEWPKPKREKTPEERRAKLIEGGVGGLFGGAVFATVLYAAGNLISLQLPPEWIAGAPFDVGAVQRLAWLVGLFPMTAGLGQLVSGLTMRLPPPEPQPLPEPPQPLLEATSAEEVVEPPPSVTEHTTARLPARARQ